MTTDTTSPEASAAAAAVLALAEVDRALSATFTTKLDGAGLSIALVHVQHQEGGRGDILIRCAYGYLYVDAGDMLTTKTIPRSLVRAAAEAVRGVAIDRGFRTAELPR